MICVEKTKKGHKMEHKKKYKDQFQDIAQWMPLIMEAAKKDLKNEHLKKDPGFLKKYFSHNNIAKISTEELSEAYLKAFRDEQETDSLGDFITSRWLLKHSEIYEFFERVLSKINPDFASITQLDDAQSTSIINEAVQQFGAINTYLFSILNGVVFTEASLQDLKARAKNEEMTKCEEEKRQQEVKSFESLKHNHAQEIARLTDKYEKKLSGLQKKYMIDVDCLKKQLANLQRKLQG